MELEAPKNRKGVKRILGITGFYRKFVSHYAQLTAPLSELLAKDVPFVWGPEQKESLAALKKAVAADVCLMMPNFEKQFVVHADASDRGLGCALLQEDEHGDLRPVAFASRKLTKAERNYTITE
eukprot:Nk52_evm1s1777 gene=Nk52_evmTU1s1777